MPSPADRTAPLGPVANAKPTGLTPSVLWSAFGRATALVTVVAVAVWLLGVVPADCVNLMLLGVTGALVATGLAVLLKGSFLGPRAMATMVGDGKLAAARLQSMMAAGLGLKLALVTIGFVALRFGLRVKFEQTAAFAVAFAAASLICQVTVAGILWRALSARPVVSQVASAVTSGTPQTGTSNTGTSNTTDRHPASPR